MSSAGNGLCMCVYVSIHKLYLLPATTSHLSLPDTSVHWNKRERLPHHYSPPPPAFPSLSFSLFPLRHLLHAIYRRPSISPACQRAFSFGLLLQGARRWQITTRQPVIFDLSEPPSLCAPLLSRPHSLPSPASIQTRSNSSSPQCPTHLHPPLFPPTNHIFLLRSAQKIWLACPKTKKKGRNIVAVEAFKLERQLVLYYYLGLCHW